MGLRAHPLQAIGHVERPGEFMQILHVVGAGGTARTSAEQQRGVGTVRRRQGLDGQVSALQPLKPTDKQQHRRIRQLQRSTCAGPATGRKEGVIDAQRNFFDTGRIGVVEPNQLFGFDGGVGQNDVGAADGAGFRHGPFLGLGVVGLGLHPGQGVERHGERPIEFVFQHMPSFG